MSGWRHNQTIPLVQNEYYFSPLVGDYYSSRALGIPTPTTAAITRHTPTMAGVVGRVRGARVELASHPWERCGMPLPHPREMSGATRRDHGRSPASTDMAPQPCLPLARDDVTGCNPFSPRHRWPRETATPSAGVKPAPQHVLSRYTLNIVFI